MRNINLQWPLLPSPIATFAIRKITLTSITSPSHQTLPNLPRSIPFPYQSNFLDIFRMNILKEKLSQYTSPTKIARQLRRGNLHNLSNPASSKPPLIAPSLTNEYSGQVTHMIQHLERGAWDENEGVDTAVSMFVDCCFTGFYGRRRGNACIGFCLGKGRR